METFPSMETDGQKRLGITRESYNTILVLYDSLAIAARDQIVISRVNAVEDARNGSYERNLFTNELCANRQTLYGIDADSAGTKEFFMY